MNPVRESVPSTSGIWDVKGDTVEMQIDIQVSVDVYMYISYLNIIFCVYTRTIICNLNFWYEEFQVRLPQNLFVLWISKRPYFQPPHSPHYGGKCFTTFSVEAQTFWLFQTRSSWRLYFIRVRVKLLKQVVNVWVLRLIRATFPM